LGPFNKTYDQGISQDQLYEDLVPPFIEAYLGGVNCTFFMYG
jgi:hypothetical protein